MEEARADILTEFLEAAIHLVLYVREIYPAAIFKPRRKYNVTVHMSCHWELNQYIRKTLSTVHSLLLQDALEKVEVAITDNDSHVLEMFVFTMELLNDSTTKENRDTYLLEIEESLRAVLLKISISDTLLKPHPPNCKFTVFVHTNNSAAASLEHKQQTEAFPWIRSHSHERDLSGLPDVIIPLRTVSSEIIKMDVHLTTACSWRERPSQGVTV